MKQLLPPQHVLTYILPNLNIETKPQKTSRQNKTTPLLGNETIYELTRKYHVSWLSEARFFSFLYSTERINQQAAVSQALREC